MKDRERRTLAIGLDAFDIELAERLTGEARLPNLSKLIGQSAFFRLHHDERAKFTGLGWEHFSTGKGPEAQQRWSAIIFDPINYSVHQPQSANPPFIANSATPTVVFDLPYFDLEAAPNTRGITSWGAHDPGTEAYSRPTGLRDEVEARFGKYPAPEWIYGFSWPSVQKTKAAGKALLDAVNLRSDITRWLLTEKLSDWKLAIAVVSETHSAIEQFWHGVDPNHPLHSYPSADAARTALVDVYEAIDAFIGAISETFPDTTLIVFSMHGMGANTSDLPAMFLLPELLYRRAFRRPYAREESWPSRLPGGMPLFGTDESWDKAMRKIVPWPDTTDSAVARLRRFFGNKHSPSGRNVAGNIGWMPAARYAPFWPSMRAFAFPAYYDAWVRINLTGREGNGLVSPDEYEAERRDIRDILHQCRDPLSGSTVIDKIVLSDKEPYQIGPTEADIYVTFAPNTTGLTHPQLGTIGPVPFRRTGGHTGDWGVLLAKGADIQPGDRGLANSFDVAPTILNLIGENVRPDLSGKSLMSRIHKTSPVMP